MPFALKPVKCSWIFICGKQQTVCTTCCLPLTYSLVTSWHACYKIMCFYSLNHRDLMLSVSLDTKSCEGKFHQLLKHTICDKAASLHQKGIVLKMQVHRIACIIANIMYSFIKGGVLDVLFYHMTHHNLLKQRLTAFLFYLKIFNAAVNKNEI